MPIDFAVVKTSLYDWAVSVVPMGMPVIYWQPNAPRPNVAYVTLFLNSIVSVGQDWTDDETDVTGTVNMQGNRQFTLQVQAYGGDPLTVLENMRTSLQKQSVLDTLQVSGIAFYQAINISDITDLVDSQFERRATLDILFGIGQTYSDNAGYFDVLEVEEIIEDATGSIIFDETFTIPNP